MNEYSFRSIYSFNLIKIQTDLSFGIMKIGLNELRFSRFKSQNARLEVL
jgi:hypothetical protein